ncbi:MAG: zinc ribbon domain-containing protein [Candidatus Lokiarchaeota archaeon]|nr:zinc ribbon domain-containing protein [Candidatus Lokiarchaeota archaeon]
MASGYCEHCQQQVLTKREDINMILAIILTIFTAILGLIIYLAVWSSKPENRCVQCNSIVSQPMDVRIQNSNNPYETSQNDPYEASQNNSIEEEYIPDFSLDPINERESEVLTGGRSQFCSLCGEKIEIGTRFCQSCGNKL